MFYIESNALGLVENITNAEERLKSAVSKYHDEIYEGILYSWLMESPVFGGEYEHPNDYGSPHGLGGTLRDSVVKFSVKDYTSDPKSIGGYSVESLFTITGIRNKRNWYDDYDYALKFAGDFENDESDEIYISFRPLVREEVEENFILFREDVLEIIADAFKGKGGV